MITRRMLKVNSCWPGMEQ